MPCVSRVPPGGPRDGVQYGCEVNNGYCMSAGEEGNCGTCFKLMQRGSATYVFKSFSDQQRCEECEVVAAPDGMLPLQVTTEFDEPCKKCIPGERKTLQTKYGISYIWSDKKIIDKPSPGSPCDKCVLFLFPNPREVWQDCAAQNPGASNCECDTSNPKMPRCVCCDTPCGVCEECTKVGRRKKCKNICRNLDNNICVGGNPTTGTKGNCVCMFLPYNPAGISMTQLIDGYQMCTEAEPSLKANCKGCECTVTCFGQTKIDPDKCKCVPMCADCTPNSQSFGALEVTSSCQECREKSPGNWGCVDICIPPAVCDGSGGCYTPKSSLGLSLLP